jgi:hypothetical protein
MKSIKDSAKNEIRIAKIYKKNYLEPLQLANFL